MRLSSFLKSYGPGIAVAATGVGAGDLVAASVAGAKFGIAILWSALVGAVIKFALNEGVARWQLATGTTMIEGWSSRLPRFVSYYFLVYLLLWSLVVAAALISACGLAGHAIVPQLSVTTWGMIHSVVGAALVILGRYRLFEKLMKFFTALMFVTVIACAVMIVPKFSSLTSWLVPTVPEGSARFILSVVGGVGGSVTLLSYGYWIREKQWEGTEHHKHTQRDLGVAYALTGIFGAAMMIIAAGVNPAVVTGDTMALEVAQRIGDVIGPTGKWMFLLGFWGAVFTSLFGVWQSVPYLFADCVTSLKRSTDPGRLPRSISPDSWYYKGFLLYLAFPPMALLVLGKPVWVIILYSITGSFFMPFLALALLWMNTRWAWVGELRNSWWTNTLLVLSLLLFGYLCFVELSAL